MIYLNILSLVLIFISLIFIFFMNRKMMELENKIDNNEEANSIRLNDIDKKIKIINNKKW